MATLEVDQRSNKQVWYVRFYYGGNRYKHSCRNANQKRAQQVLATVEATLEKLHNGHLDMPGDADPKEWIVAGGRLPAVSSHPRPKSTLIAKPRITFGHACDTYFSEQLEEGAKAATTLASERTHIGHLKRLIGRSRLLESVTLEVLKRYRTHRKQEKYRGNVITEALRREFATFRLIWIWAQDNSHVSLPCPLLRSSGRWRISLPNPTEPIKFQTWDQIERRTKRGGLSDDEVRELWNSLFLDWHQVQELLVHVKQNAQHGFIYPMFAFTAYTGARRSEILRSRIDDIDFEANQVMIRERKRRKHLSGSTRHVPLHPDLKSILFNWFLKGNHPGGQFTIAAPLEMARRKPSTSFQSLTWSQGTHHFKRALKESKWQVVRGFHVLRHSFGSNLIRTGKVSPDVVARWMGHTSDEMRQLYQHLFPQDGVNQISALGEKVVSS